MPYSGRIGSTELVLPKWHKYGILNTVIRVGLLKLADTVLILIKPSPSNVKTSLWAVWEKQHVQYT